MTELSHLSCTELLFSLIFKKAKSSVRLGRERSCWLSFWWEWGTIASSSWGILFFQGFCRQMIKWPWRRSPGSCSWKMWLGTKFLWVTSLTPPEPFLGHFPGLCGMELAGTAWAPHRGWCSLCWLSSADASLLFLKTHQLVPLQEGKREICFNKPQKKQTEVFQSYCKVLSINNVP